MSKTINDKLSEGRQYRNIAADALTLRTLEDGQKVVEGYATVFDTPYTLVKEDGYTLVEQVDKDAFQDCDMKDVIMQYDHVGRVFARVSNGTLEVKPDDKGLFIRAFLGGTELGRQVFEEIEGGYTTKMSFGFAIKTKKHDVERDEETGETTVTRTITKISKLYDVSAVSLPANDATSINARALFDGVVEELKAERLKRRKLALKLKIAR